jgi:hypothetical protein
MASLVAAAVIGVAAPAAALAEGPRHGGGKGGIQRAKVLRGALSPVREDVAAYAASAGSARLVATARTASLVVRVRRLAPRTRYAWALIAGDCTGAPVEGLKYRVVRTGGSGSGTGRAVSRKRRFRRDLATGYSVVVLQAGTIDEPVLCGVLSVTRRGTGRGGKGRRPLATIGPFGPRGAGPAAR